MLGARIRTIAAGLAGLLLAATSAAAQAPSGPPIKIGFSMALTGGLALNGTMGLVAMKMWAADTNKKGGLLGRPVVLDYYDDQSNPANVPGIYTKLLDVDKCDFVISGYATNITAPAMPIIIAHKMTFISLFALDVNSEFKYPNYFSMLPVGPNPREAITNGFFQIVKANEKKLGLKTIAFLADDGEATLNAIDGAHTNWKKYAPDLKKVYDRTYPPTTNDFSPIVRALQAIKPDVVVVAAYPPDSVGIIRSVHELGLDTKIFGGGFTGPQTTSAKMALGSALNGIITFDWWLPAPKLQFPGVMDLMARYQKLAVVDKTDPLGYYLVPWAYADLQVLGQAIQGTNGTNQQKVADYIRSHHFSTVVGDVSFGAKGEWAKSRVLTVQFRGITGASLDQFRDGKGEFVVGPPEYKTTDPVLPYSSFKH
ncbi:MAG: amino acid ABC transporter substrate-binding protein [Stellaceae bacterium]